MSHVEKKRGCLRKFTRFEAISTNLMVKKFIGFGIDGKEIHQIGSKSIENQNMLSQNLKICRCAALQSLLLDLD